VLKRACLITRQRVVGNTNGSSVYLLSICEALRANGYALTLISPSPAAFGRWPFLRLGREMDIFDGIWIRGSWRIGRRLFLARDPRTHVTAVLTVLERLLLRLRLVKQARVKRAPYSIAVPWTRNDRLYIARHAPADTNLVIADYAFATPAIPYTLRPRARNFVVMHDLFSSRASQFDSVGSSDSVASLDEESEIALLGQARSA
jgi:succinoglycan biosynthesis protein ExoO